MPMLAASSQFKHLCLHDSSARYRVKSSWEKCIMRTMALLLPCLPEQLCVQVCHADSSSWASLIGSRQLLIEALYMPLCQVASVPGDDEMVLSLLLAFEKLLGPMPPPPLVAACSGCQANVTNVEVSFCLPSKTGRSRHLQSIPICLYLFYKLRGESFVRAWQAMQWHLAYPLIWSVYQPGMPSMNTSMAQTCSS